MRVETKRRFRNLLKCIDQADAVVIGGGSACQARLDYDHYHWSQLSEALAPFANSMALPLSAGWIHHCFSSYGEQWGYYSQYIRFMWEAYWAALSGPAGACCGQTCFVLTTNVDQQFFEYFPETNLRLSGEFNTANAVSPAGMILGKPRTGEGTDWLPGRCSPAGGLFLVAGLRAGAGALGTR